MTNIRLEEIEFSQYPNLLLHCENDVVFEASLNERNRKKLDAMTTFPELSIEDYNPRHGTLSADGLSVVVFLQKC